MMMKMMIIICTAVSGFLLVVAQCQYCNMAEHQCCSVAVHMITQRHGNDVRMRTLCIERSVVFL